MLSIFFCFQSWETWWKLWRKNEGLATASHLPQILVIKVKDHQFNLVAGSLAHTYFFHILTSRAEQGFFFSFSLFWFQLGDFGSLSQSFQQHSFNNIVWTLNQGIWRTRSQNTTSNVFPCGDGYILLQIYSSKSIFTLFELWSICFIYSPFCCSQWLICCCCSMRIVMAMIV